MLHLEQYALQLFRSQIIIIKTTEWKLEESRPPCKFKSFAVYLQEFPALTLFQFREDDRSSIVRTAPVTDPMLTFILLPRKILSSSPKAPVLFTAPLPVLFSAPLGLSASLPPSPFSNPLSLTRAGAHTHTPQPWLLTKKHPASFLTSIHAAEATPTPPSSGPTNWQQHPSSKFTGAQSSTAQRCWWKLDLEARPAAPGLPRGSPSLSSILQEALTPFFPSGDVGGGRGEAAEPPDFLEVLPLAGPVNLLS